MGSKRRTGVRKVSDSSLEIAFTWNDKRYRERIKMIPDTAGLNWAERHRGKVINDIATGTFDYAEAFPDSDRAKELASVPGDHITVEDALQGFLKGAEKRVARSTYLDWCASARSVLVPQFGDHALSELTAKHVRDWIDSHNLTQKRICNILTPLRQVMTLALEDEKIDTNPLSTFKVKKRQVDEMRELDEDIVDPFTSDEINSILPHLNPQAANYVTFCVWTGLRVEEAIEVKWSDVDEEKRTIEIRRARTRKEVKQPKTKSGRRTVKLLPPAWDALMAQREHTGFEKGHIFHDPRTGKPYLTDKQFRMWQWQPALKEAKVRYRPPRQLRHTYATWMINAGEPIKRVSMQMGHKSTKMTLDVYLKWLPDDEDNFGLLALEKHGKAVQKATMTRF